MIFYIITTSTITDWGNFKEPCQKHGKKILAILNFALSSVIRNYVMYTTIEVGKGLKFCRKS